MVYLFHSTQNNQRVFLYVVYVVGGLVFRSRLPLREDLPELLPAGGMRAPSISILLLIFIGQHRLKRPASQVEVDDVSGSEGPDRQRREEEFVDHPLSGLSHRGRSGRGGMRGHNHSAAFSRRTHLQSGKIEESALCSRFRMSGLVIGGSLQTRLNGLQVEQMGILASHDVG